MPRKIEIQDEVLHAMALMNDSNYVTEREINTYLYNNLWADFVGLSRRCREIEKILRGLDDKKTEPKSPEK